MARTGGLEPPPSGFVIRGIVRFCYVRRFWHRQPDSNRCRLVENRASLPLDDGGVNWLPDVDSNHD